MHNYTKMFLIMVSLVIGVGLYTEWKFGAKPAKSTPVAAVTPTQLEEAPTISTNVEAAPVQTNLTQRVSANFNFNPVLK